MAGLPKRTAVQPFAPISSVRELTARQPVAPVFQSAPVIRQSSEPVTDIVPTLPFVKPSFVEVAFISDGSHLVVQPVEFPLYFGPVTFATFVEVDKAPIIDNDATTKEVFKNADFANVAGSSGIAVDAASQTVSLAAANLAGRKVKRKEVKRAARRSVIPL